MPPVTAVLHAHLTAAIIVPIIVVAAAWLAVSVRRWRRISWRDQLDTSTGLLPKQARGAAGGEKWGGRRGGRGQAAGDAHVPQP
ncbi:MAG TPA: hypothetical protein VHZ03_39845 [Trebonia sp.]|nr:hypothetical protein [Trebonia sp.]